MYCEGLRSKDESGILVRAGAGVSGRAVAGCGAGVIEGSAGAATGAGMVCWGVAAGEYATAPNLWGCGVSNCISAVSSDGAGVGAIVGGGVVSTGVGAAVSGGGVTATVGLSIVPSSVASSAVSVCVVELALCCAACASRSIISVAFRRSIRGISM